MYMSAAPSLDCDAWLTEKTVWCTRLSARISEATCKSNHKFSGSEGGDLRCEGCNGLHDQCERPKPVLVVTPPPVCDESESCTESLFETTAKIDLSGLEIDVDESRVAEILDMDKELAAALKSILDGDDEDLADNAETLPTESAIRTRRHKQERPRRVAVYMGRCPRCGGYCVNTIESQFDERDDEVYRCFTCGHRTSPQYEINRATPVSFSQRGGR